MPTRTSPPRFERARQTPVTSWDLARAAADHRVIDVTTLLLAVKSARDAAIDGLEHNMPPAGSFVASLNGSFDSLQIQQISDVFQEVTEAELQYRSNQRQLRGESE